LANLFKGYKAATDDVFVKYIEKKEEDYDGGHGIQPMRLMELMERNKYKTMGRREQVEGPFRGRLHQDHRHYTLYR
jgi:hypothetical protein